MARRRNREYWVTEPRRHGNRWRIETVDRDGRRDYCSFETEAEALEAKRALELKMQTGEATIETALTAYELHQTDVLGNKARTIKTSVERITLFFPDRNLELARLTEVKCQALYRDLKKHVGKKSGVVVSVDTHRGTLNTARTFLAFCVVKKWITRNPLASVKGEGRLKCGKKQLRIDEARKWTEAAIGEAAKGESGPVAALATFYMGFRCSEVIERVARDLDDDGKLLWIPDTKTEAGKRTVEVPEFLREFFVALTKDKVPEAKLFGEHHRQWVRYWVRRICKLAGVPTVTAHGMRGLHGTLAVQAGTTSHVVAASMGHASISTTLKHYAGAGSQEAATQKAVLKMVRGGK